MVHVYLCPGSNCGVFPPGSDFTDVNATCRSKDGSLLASGDDFGLVKLFEYPVSVSFCKDSNLIKFPIHVLLDLVTSYPANKVAWIFPRKRKIEATPKKRCCSRFLISSQITVRLNGSLLGSISVSGQLRTYPSPNLTCYNKLIS